MLDWNDMEERPAQDSFSDTQQPEPATGAPQPAAGTDRPADPEGETVSRTEQAGADGETGALTVRYNHQTRQLTREQAVELAQKGLKYQSLAPAFERIGAAARAAGMSPARWLEETAARADAVRYAETVRQCGGNTATADRLLTAERQADEAQRQEQLTNRLATGFLELSRLCPDVRDLSDVPETVLADAVCSGRELTDAYLRYRWRENRRIEQADLARRTAAASSAGAMRAGTGDIVTSEIAAMMEGVRRRS
ncbi:MAG: hypothetical protein IKI50_05245 [Clostridia bacterium]|nr:hypothetical protein [Clostridia bacterium]